MIAVVDSGPLYAAVDADDDDHGRCLEVLRRADLDLVVPALVIAEVTYLVGRRLGPETEASFLRGIADLEIEAPSDRDLAAMAALVKRYGDFPLGGTDASVAVLADRLGSDLIVTLDQRHFTALRSTQGRPYRILPG
ncbi:MAG: type II toxin-antitoxin system VapC family toxin [Chloroflexota bacterium]